MRNVLMLLVGCLVLGQAEAKFVDDYAKLPEVLGASISPTGKYLAVAKEEDNKVVVAVFEYPKIELINVIDFPGRNEVGGFWWVC